MIDFIGDIHGDATALFRLLRALNYKRVDGAYRNADGRIAVFTGDLVDTGPENLLVVETVQEMVERGTAKAVMGNHDFNIVAFNRPDPNRPGRFLRNRSAQHTKQCETTQSEIDAQPGRGARALAFLAALPLWLDLPGARVVHAYWDPGAMKVLRPHLTPSNTLTEEGFVLAAARSGAIGDARAQLLSGPEISCEPYLDRYGHKRTKDRLRWWETEQEHHPAPVFFGHYALPTPLAPFANAVCVDGGIAKGREIVAYRHALGSLLTRDNYRYA